MLFELETEKWSELTEAPVATSPAWSRDGEYVYFGTDEAIQRVRIGDRKVERVADLRGVSRFEVDRGPWLGLDLDDSPLILRSTSSNEIYALDWEGPSRVTAEVPPLRPKVFISCASRAAWYLA